MIPRGLKKQLGEWEHPLTSAGPFGEQSRFVWGELDDENRAVLIVEFRKDRWVFHSLRSSWAGDRLVAFLCRVLGGYAVEHGVEEFEVLTGGRATGLWEQAGFRQTENGYVAQTSDVLAYGESKL